MRIAFLTSCLEPGRDGAGDYSRALAEECTQAGHATCLVALNDRHVTETSETGLLRLGSRLPWEARIQKTQTFLSNFSPDCVSLQFVCYGFNPRGINLRLPDRLKKITGRTPVQIMFHELWIGAETGASLKHRLIGSIQRHGILKLVRELQPRLVHTSNPTYTQLLHRNGIRAVRLPLFGNIPIVQNLPAVPHASDTWTFGMFGTLHPIWPPEPLFERLRVLGKKIVIAHIGRIGAGEALWNQMTHDYGDVFEFQRLGEQPPDKIAEFFSQIDFGISTTPWALIGKSGTVTAMLEHGLPVIVNRDDVHYGGCHVETGSRMLIKLDDKLSAHLSATTRQPPRRKLPEVARQFLADMQRAL